VTKPDPVLAQAEIQELDAQRARLQQRLRSLEIRGQVNRAEDQLAGTQGSRRQQLRPDERQARSDEAKSALELARRELAACDVALSRARERYGVVLRDEDLAHARVVRHPPGRPRKTAEEWFQVVRGARAAASPHPSDKELADAAHMSDDWFRKLKRRFGMPED
jgi:hypothetical protein